MNTGTFRVASNLSSKELGAAATTTETQFKDSKSGVLILYAPGSGALAFRPFRIFAAGRVIAGTGTPNFTVSIYWGISATIASNTKLATTGAVATATTQGNWALVSEPTLWDNTSQRLIGLTKGFVHATAVAQVINTGIITAVDLNTATTSEGQGFTITGTWGTGNASNAAYVDSFELTVL